MTAVTHISTERCRVLLADDHALILEAFSSLLGDAYDVVGTVSDGRELLNAAPRLRPDVIVLDIYMPNLNGLDAASKLRKTLPEVKLVFLTMNQDPAMIAEALNIEGSAYLLKSSASTELFQAIEAVMSGKPYVTPLIEGDMLDTLRDDEGRRRVLGKLTLRQREVLQLLVEGNTMKEVAETLNVTPRTVAFHKYRMMQDLKIKTNSELIQFAIKNGLIASSP